jgi:hypothetical protein
MEWIDDIHCLLKRFVIETDELITINLCFVKCIDVLREFKSIIMMIEMIMIDNNINNNDADDDNSDDGNGI